MEESSVPIAAAHRAALRSIERVVKESAEPHEPEYAANGIASMLDHRRVLVLTGAGVSTDSGIPDYRGPGGSLLRHRPMTYQEFKYDPAARHRYWARSYLGWRHIDLAEPNPTHLALARLEAAGYLSGLITQNVDGLHQRAGSRDVIALHGDLGTVSCLHCGATEPRTSLDARLDAANAGFLASAEIETAQINPDGDVALAPEQVARFSMVGCLVCGSQELKPDVVYFGENIPPERKARVAAMADESRALLVVGSSLAVMSGYKLVLDAKAAGKPVGIINGGPSRGDIRADYRWRTRVAPAIEQLLQRLGGF